MAKKHPDQITLGELIELLSARDKDQSVYFDFCNVRALADVDSYRGYYEDLAIAYACEGPAKSVGDLLSVLRGAVSTTFTGYKGGEYYMGLDTPLWVGNYGNSSSTAISGLVDCEWSTIIKTVYVP